MKKPVFAFIPKAFKNSKVYSQYPQTSDSDFDFARSSVATRITEKGLLEEVSNNEPRINKFTFEPVPYTNLFPFTSDITRWREDNNGFFFEPNEEDQVFDLLKSKVFGVQYDGGGFTHRVNLLEVYAPDSTINATFYVKPMEKASSFAYRLRTVSGSFDSRISVTFTGDGEATVSNDSTASTSLSIEKSSNGFFKVFGRFAGGGLVSGQEIEVRLGGNTTSSQSEQKVLVTGLSWNGDFEERNSLVDYYENKIETPHLTLEDTSENVISTGQTLTGGAWTSTNFSITANSGADLFGKKEASLVVRDTSSSSFLQHVTSKSAIEQTRTFSLFIKPRVNCKILNLATVGAGSNQCMVKFNLENNRVSYKFEQGFTLLKAGVQDYGNGWKRCYFTAETDATSQTIMRVSIAREESLLGQQNVSNDQGSGVEAYIFGAQNEEKEFLTSYIKTVGSTVTRSKETLANGIIEEQNLSDLSLYIVSRDNGYSSTGTRRMTISDNTNTGSALRLYYQSSGQIISVIANGGTQFSFIGDTVTDQRRVNSIASTLKFNSHKVYVNGEEKAEDTSVPNFTIGTIDRVNFNQGVAGNEFYCDLFALLVFNYPLSLEEIKELDRHFKNI